MQSLLLSCLLISVVSAYKPVSPLRRLTVAKTRSTEATVTRAMQQLEAPAEDLSSQSSIQLRDSETETYALATDVLKSAMTVTLALTEFLLFITGKSFKFVSDVLQILFFSPPTARSPPSSSLSLSSSSLSSLSSPSVEKKPLTYENKVYSAGSFDEYSTSSLPTVSSDRSLSVSTLGLTNVKKTYWPVKSARVIPQEKIPCVVSGSSLFGSENLKKPRRSYSVSKVYWPQNQASISSPSVVTEEKHIVVKHNVHLETVHATSTKKLAGENIIEIGTSKKFNEDSDFAAKLAKANAAAEASLEQERAAAKLLAASLKARVLPTSAHATSASVSSSGSSVGNSGSLSPVSQPKKRSKKSYGLSRRRRK